MSSFLVVVRVDRSTHLRPLKPPSGPKNEPKQAQTYQICLCTRSNSKVRDPPSLKSPKECLYHVCHPFWCPGGPYHTIVTIRAPLRPKKPSKICPNQADLSLSMLKKHSKGLSQPRISQGMSISFPPSQSVSRWTIPNLWGHRGPSQAQNKSLNVPKLTRFAFDHAQIAQ